MSKKVVHTNMASSCLISSVALMGCLLLTGCSHDNTLTSNTTEAGKRAAAQFLLDTAKTAGKPIVAKANYKGKGSDLYEDCMNGGYDNKAICQSLYQAMADAAQKTTTYHRLTASDIASHAMWQLLGDDYDNIRFNDFVDLPTS